MAIFPAKDSTTGKKELSIVVLKLDIPIVTGQHLCAQGMGSFSSFRVRSADRNRDTILEKARVIQRTYSLVKGDDTSTKLEVVKGQRQSFELLDRSYFLARPAPVVAAFTM
jgi:hypothetical protein